MLVYCSCIVFNNCSPQRHCILWQPKLFATPLPHLPQIRTLLHRALITRTAPDTARASTLIEDKLLVRQPHSTPPAASASSPPPRRSRLHDKAATRKPDTRILCHTQPHQSNSNWSEEYVGISLELVRSAPAACTPPEKPSLGFESGIVLAWTVLRCWGPYCASSNDEH